MANTKTPSMPEIETIEKWLDEHTTNPFDHSLLDISSPVTIDNAGCVTLHFYAINVAECKRCEKIVRDCAKEFGYDGNYSFDVECTYDEFSGKEVFAIKCYFDTLKPLNNNNSKNK